jgi:tRNA(Ile)-lysidine synthase TilS/MesJ
MTVSERIQRRFGKASVEFRLIEDGDKILVGLSGGKDSLCLLELLAKRSRVHRPQFSVEAAHIRMENIHYETDASYLQSFCDKLGVPLHVITTRLLPPTTQAKKKPMCFLCSWQRRKQLFNLAQELGCNKIALGHHQDDIIHTALMNLTFQGHFSTMPAKLRMRKMPLTIIRPLCLCQEADIRAYAEQQGYEKQLKQCPYEKATNRTTASELFAHIQQLNPEARYCIWRALESDNKLVEY